MDPIANIKEQREIAAHMIARLDTANREGRAFTSVEQTYQLDDGERLAELVIALDEWRQNGGFDPWNREQLTAAIREHDDNR